MENKTLMHKELGEGFVPAERNKKEMKPALMVEAISFSGEDPDETKYLLILIMEDPDDHEFSSWEVTPSTGRQATYNFLKSLVLETTINMDRSFVISEFTSIKKAITVYRFLKSMKEQEMVIDNTDFELDPYRYPEYYGKDQTGDIFDSDKEQEDIKTKILTSYAID